MEDAADYQRRAAALQRGSAVVVLNPRSPDAPLALVPWCGFAQTVALVGSSGVSKSSLVNKLTASGEPLQQTGGVREHDAKGRHTTTSRSLHAMAGGGWVMDTPGMRTLHVSDASHGLAVLFAEITELAPLCRFRDYTHAHEPKCAVQAAIRDGTVDPDRLARWRNLVDENHTSPTPAAARGASKSTGRAKRR